MTEEGAGVKRKGRGGALRAGLAGPRSAIGVSGGAPNSPENRARACSPDPSVAERCLGDPALPIKDEPRGRGRLRRSLTGSAAPP